MKTNQHNETNDEVVEQDATQSSEGSMEDETVDVTSDTSMKTAEEMATEYLRDLQRCQADFSNYKKRQQESQKELAGYLIEKLVMDITPVLDNFQMATSHVPADATNSPWVIGIQYIEKQLEKVLTDNGLEVLEAQVGDVFDPSIHEAIKNVGEDNTVSDARKDETEIVAQVIAEVLQKGYKIGNKVIRPVKVAVK